ncbi:MAG: mannonate dehydratase [Pseudomonadota bacterium]
MRQTWRWFGPHDTVSVDDMLQAGVEGVVTALHHVPAGAAWTVDAIKARQAEIATMVDGTPSGLGWEVVESLPVSEAIKQQSGDWREHLDAYRASLENLAACGIETVCYNFMPVLDWTRTDLAHRLPSGATCMRFDLADFAAFDVHILERPGAADDFVPEIVAEAEARFASMDDDRRRALADTVVCGLPGTDTNYSLADLRMHLALYGDVSDDVLRQRQVDFLGEVVPTAERLGLRLCCHPDDPPFPLLGLPRVMSSENDYRRLVEAVPSPANGITLCTGSLGVSAAVDLPGMIRRLGGHVAFVHLRNVARETVGNAISFHEAAHLEGVTDMVAVIDAILGEEHRRRAAGRADHDIPFRPDHGHDILSDLNVRSQPGYPAVGRLRGLAELRGIMTALSATRYADAKRGHTV